MNATNESDPAVLSAGILVADVFVPPLPRLPEAGQLFATDDFQIGAGGCAANVALVLRKLGVTVAVAGCVGKDPLGDFLIDHLSEHEIGTTAIRRLSSSGTSKTVILPVIGEDRRYIHTVGANAEFTVADIRNGLGSRVRALYLGGFMLLPCVDAVEAGALLAEARKLGLFTILDVTIPSDSSARLLQIEPMLQHVDYFLPNHDEGVQLTGESDPLRQAAVLQRAGAGTVVITLGAAGAVIVSADSQFQVPSPIVDVVDPSGAGDAFAAGLITSLLEGSSIQEGVVFAAAVGASACRALGCTDGVPEGVSGRAELARLRAVTPESGFESDPRSDSRLGNQAFPGSRPDSRDW